MKLLEGPGKGRIGVIIDYHHHYVGDDAIAVFVKEDEIRFCDSEDVLELV